MSEEKVPYHAHSSHPSHEHQELHVAASVAATQAAVQAVTDASNQPAPAPIKGLSIGRIVHFVLPDGPGKGEHRPAIIVNIWDKASGKVNLQVFMDGSNDVPTYYRDDYAPDTKWETSVHHSDTHEPRTWHFPELVP